MKKLSCLLLLVVPVFAASAQTRYSILLGEVRDPSTKQPIAGAIVTTTAWPDTTRTDSAGRFIVRAIPRGRVSVRVERSGYRDVAIPDFDIASDTLYMKFSPHSEPPKSLEE